MCLLFRGVFLSFPVSLRSDHLSSPLCSTVFGQLCLVVCITEVVTLTSCLIPGSFGVIDGQSKHSRSGTGGRAQACLAVEKYSPVCVNYLSRISNFTFVSPPGYSLCLGKSYFFRFNHPEEASRMKSMLPQKSPVSALAYNTGTHTFIQSSFTGLLKSAALVTAPKTSKYLTPVGVPVKMRFFSCLCVSHQ